MVPLKSSEVDLSVTVGWPLAMSRTWFTTVSFTLVVFETGCSLQSFKRASWSPDLGVLSGPCFRFEDLRISYSWCETQPSSWVCICVLTYGFNKVYKIMRICSRVRIQCDIIIIVLNREITYLFCFLPSDEQSWKLSISQFCRFYSVFSIDEI